MLRRLRPNTETGFPGEAGCLENAVDTGRPSPGAVVKIADAAFPKIFPWRLEYNCPVHENWNIVHTGMLIPQCHQIYVCSTNCLRGVIMTADEMDAAKRISSVMPTEREVVSGRLEQVTIDGVSDVILRLPVRPRAVQVFLVCMHHLMGADTYYIFSRLRERFPDIDFMPCFMDPIMQKVSLTPEQKQRKSMMMVIPPLEENVHSAAVLGDDLRLPDDSDISRLLSACGIKAKQVMDCGSYDDYLAMGDSFLLLTRSPLSWYGLKALAQKNGRRAVYLPPVALDSQIEAELRELLSLVSQVSEGPGDMPDIVRHLGSFLEAEKTATEAAFEKAREAIGDAEVWLDYLAFPRPLRFARRLLMEGFRVKRVCMDAVSMEEKEDFYWLQENHPDLQIQSTSHVQAREKSLIRGGEAFKVPCGKILALGPKAAFFADTPYFVNWIENDGNWGYDGLRRLASAMTEAWRQPKDTRDLVQRKGLGLPSLVP